MTDYTPGSLGAAMRAPDAPPPDPEREYGLACTIMEGILRTWRQGFDRTDVKKLREFALASDYLIERNTLRINGE